MSTCIFTGLLTGNQIVFRWYQIFIYSMVFKKQREKGLVQIKQQDFVSPKGDTTQGMDEQIDFLLRQRFARLHQRQKMHVVRSALENLFGRHHPVNHKPQYHFKQRWEQARSHLQQQHGYSFLRSQNLLLNIIYYTIFAMFGVMLWFLSIYRLFGMDQSFQGFLLLSFIAFIADGLMKFVHYINGERAGQKGELVAYLRSNIKDCFFLLYLLALLLEELIQREKQSYFFVIDVVFLLIGRQRFEELFSGIKIAILSSRYRNQLQILQLVGGCLLKVHIFSLFLFCASRIDLENNWTMALPFFYESWISKYVYSLYFTCTTMFTVGYGDITPKNLTEITTIMFIQIIGVINLGYIINQIGRFLSKINEGQEVLYRDISSAEKVADAYKLPRELAARMRNYLINHTLDSHQVNLDEEDLFLRKLNDDLRTDIDSFHKLETVKNSIFFICHWSKKFKQRVATNLLKVLYAPQETLTQVHGKEKIFILVSGKIDLGINMQSRGGGPAKSLRVISIDPNKEVQDNVYGYSSCVSGLPVKLQAVAKGYCMVYTIDREQIQEIITQSQRDFEYYHSIKSRIEVSKIRQEWEAPQVRNTRQHYSPNPYYILKKDRIQSKKMKRKFKIRSAKKVSFIIQSQFLSTENQISASQDESKSYPKSLKTVNDLSKSEKKNYRNGSNDPNKILISTRDQRHKLKRKQEPLSQEKRLKKEKEEALNDFQNGKRYQEYFPKWNKYQSIAKYNKLAGWKENLDIAVEKQKILIHKQITEEVAQKLMNIRTIASSHRYNQ